MKLLIITMIVFAASFANAGITSIGRILETSSVRLLDEPMFMLRVGQNSRSAPVLAQRTGVPQKVTLLDGPLGNSEGFALEIESVVSSTGEISTVIRISSNTRNSALFADMQRTLSPKPVVRNQGFTGTNDEWIDTFPLTKENEELMNQNLRTFFRKAKLNSFDREIQIQRTRPNSSNSIHGNK